MNVLSSTTSFTPLAGLKVLAVGNSFSRNANFYREDLNQDNPAHKLIVAEAEIGGCSLEKHLNLALLHEQNPAAPEGKPYIYNAQPASLRDMLSAQVWDVVTIQQVSHLSDEIASYRPYAQELCDYIKRYCPKVEIVVHQVWADRVDNPRLLEKTQRKMYNNIVASNRTIARELGNLRIIPVGDAFQNLRAIWQFKTNPDLDLTKFNYSTLPDQRKTLCIGWFWHENSETGEQNLLYDHHANNAGCLLGALVWRETLLGVDSRESTFCPPEVSQEDAVVIRRIAHETVVNLRTASVFDKT